MRTGAPAPPLARRVRRLHLRAAATDDAAHAATLISDALHTASLPFADHGRFVVVRRLHLGRVSTRVSAASIALQIEHAARDVIAQAVAWDAQGALDAGAVVFASRGEALVALAALHAKGASTEAWFWPSVVPAWRDTSRQERWRLLLDRAHGLPDAAIVAAAIVKEALAAGAQDSMMNAIAEADTARWLAAEDWDRDESVRGVEGVGPIAARHLALLSHWHREWGISHRLEWVATMLAIVAHAPAAADRRVRARVRQTLRALDERRPQRAEDQSSGIVDATHEPLHDDGLSTPWRPSAATPAYVTSAESIELSAREPRVEGEGERASAVVADVLDGERTSYGGLFFVLPILARLGFELFLAANPHLIELDFASCLLRWIATRVGMTGDDPVARALGEDIHRDEIAEIVCAHVPRAVSDLMTTPMPRCAIESPIDLWLAAVRRWSRRRARMGLAALICRPARVYASRTHVEIAFHLSQLDVRVRRMALDVDPGWVSWLGRVVQYAYVDESDAACRPS